MMPTPQEFKVLKLLAKEWEYSGSPGITDISDIVAALDLTPSETLQTLKGLYRSGLVDMTSLKLRHFLHPMAIRSRKIHECKG